MFTLVWKLVTLGPVASAKFASDVIAVIGNKFGCLDRTAPGGAAAKAQILPPPSVNDSPMSHLSGKFFQVSVPTPHVYLIQVNRAPVNAFHERYGDYALSGISPPFTVILCQTLSASGA